MGLKGTARADHESYGLNVWILFWKWIEINKSFKMKIIGFTFEKDHCAVGFRELGESREVERHILSLL